MPEISDATRKSYSILLHTTPEATSIYELFNIKDCAIEVQMPQQTEILREIRERLLRLKSYARSMLTMDSKRAILQQFREIYKLFPDDLKLSFVIANVEQRLPNTIDVKLRDLQAFLTYYIPNEHPGLQYIEEELRNIRTALGKFREANKSVQDMPTREKVEKDSKTEENSRQNTTEDSTTEDSRNSGGVKEESKNAGFLRNMVRRIRGKESTVGGDTRRLLMELEALGMSIGETN